MTHFDAFQVKIEQFSTGLCDKVCKSLTTSRWLSPVTMVSSTNKTDRHDITEILLNMALTSELLDSTVI
jgi:hypothetical protein